MTEPATPVKLFGKWALDEVEVSDLALVVRAFASSNQNIFGTVTHISSPYLYFISQ